MVIYVKKLIGKFLKLFKTTKKTEWKDIEYFNEAWKVRIENMSEYIEDDDDILDLGCGEMWLKEYLSEKNRYFPVDYKDRGEGTLICNFNKYEYPNVIANTAFVSGCLEYINDYSWFVDQIVFNQTKCVLSYCTAEEFPDIKDRERRTWVNNLTKNDVIELFLDRGFTLKSVNHNFATIFVFEKLSE